MIINFECKKCNHEFDCEMGKIGIDESSMRPTSALSRIDPLPLSKNDPLAERFWRAPNFRSLLYRAILSESGMQSVASMSHLP